MDTPQSTDSQKPRVSSYPVLEAWLRDHKAEQRTLLRSTAQALYQYSFPNGKMLLVQVLACGAGWELYTTLGSRLTGESFEAVERAYELPRKEIDGPAIDAQCAGARLTPWQRELVGGALARTKLEPDAPAEEIQAALLAYARTKGDSPPRIIVGDAWQRTVDYARKLLLLRPSQEMISAECAQRLLDDPTATELPFVRSPGGAFVLGLSAHDVVQVYRGLELLLNQMRLLPKAVDEISTIEKMLDSMQEHYADAVMITRDGK